MPGHEFVAAATGLCQECGAPPRGHGGEPLPLALVDAPGRAHRDAGPAEQTAAAKVTVRSGTQRAAVLRALFFAVEGLTDDEVAAATGLLRYSAAPRRGELVEGGYVEDAGTERPSGHGGSSTVWRLTEAGVKTVEGML